MKLLWHGVWREVPGYHAPEQGVLIDVEVACPLLRLDNASERSTRRPQRKAAIFLLTDGPNSTIRKVRSKRQEPRLTGDFRLVVIMGRSTSTRERVVALAPHAPPAAQQLVVHHRLVRQIDESFSEGTLKRVVSCLQVHTDELQSSARQSYLYSGMEPPQGLIALWEEALISLVDPVRDGQVDLPGLIRPLPGCGETADTMLRIAGPVGRCGMAVALLGAGDYARTEIVPALRKAGLNLHCLADREPHIAASVARERGFRFATADAERAIAELPSPGLVVVATAHDSHASLAAMAAEAGHRVFVEKPPTVTVADVTRLVEVMTSRNGAVEIGFNRRYHPLVRRARARLSREQGPTSITCTVKELAFRPDHWYFWPNQGTRITGNLCHWIDLGVFLLDTRPLPVSVTVSPRVAGAQLPDEERVLAVTFDDGSLLTILGTNRGDDIRGVQEQIEIRRGHTTITIDDLWRMRVRSEGLERYYRTLFRHKGHAVMYREALRLMVVGEPSVYPVRDMVVVSAIQIAASDMIRGDEQVGTMPQWVAPVLQGLNSAGENQAGHQLAAVAAAGAGAQQAAGGFPDAETR